MKVHPTPPQRAKFEPPASLLPETLITVYTGDDGHIYLARGDGWRSERLTWKLEDFATIPGMPALPGVFGDLEDGHVFAHPTPSPDGRRVAAFGLLPTLMADGPEDLDEDHSWGDEEAAQSLADGLMELAAEEAYDLEEPQGDDTVFEGIIGWPETDLSQPQGDDEGFEEEPTGGGPSEGAEVPLFWPGGKVYVLDTGGVSLIEAWEMDDGRPTHLEWSPGGDHLVVLFQEEDRLNLSLVNAAVPGPALRIASGAPIFWSWRPGGEQLVLRITDPANGASFLRLQHPLGGGPSLDIGPAGSFYCAAWHPAGRLFAWSRAEEREDTLILSTHEGELLAELATYPGRGSFAWDSSGHKLALAVAPEGDGPFEVLELLEPESGDNRPLFDEPFVAFRWLPGQESLVLCATEGDRFLRWLKLDIDGRRGPIGPVFEPSDEGAVSLHFFEQLAQSHPFLSADGAYLTYVGYPQEPVVERGPQERPARDPVFHSERPSPRILVTPLDGGETVSIGVGRYACFAPAIAAG